MKNKSVGLCDAALAIAASVMALEIVAAVTLFLIFRFEILMLVSMLVLSVITAAVIILLCRTIIEGPFNKYIKSLELMNIRNRPDVSRSRLNEIKAINKAVRKFWRESFQIITYAFNAIELHSAGLFYYTSDASEVYCTKKLLELCNEEGITGHVPKKRFENMYEKITSLHFDKNYNAYLTEDFRWLRIIMHKRKKNTMGVIIDVSKRIAEIKKIEKERDVDPLTGLYNRFAFNRLAENILADKYIRSFAVIMCDIDKLKYINDTYGHDVGDRYLCKFSEAFRGFEEYGGIVARRSGDEFLALIYGGDQSAIQPIIDECKMKILSSSILVGDCAVEKIRATFGIAWYPHDGIALSDLVNVADHSLYENKYHFFLKPSLKAIDIKNEYFNRELDKIIEHKFITFSYQAIIAAPTARVFAHEALMRIYSDVIKTPEQLILIAGARSKLHLIEAMVFEKCFGAMREYQSVPSPKLFINSLPNIILPDTLTHKLFSDFLGFAVVIELMDYIHSDKEILLNKLKRFKDLAFEISIDDFSDINLDCDCIHYVDYIKLDMDIIRNININVENQKKLDEILAFARKHNIAVIAKGIDSYEEMQYAIKAGVDYLQGYYISMPQSRPAPVSDIFLEAHRAVIDQIGND